MLLDIAYFGIIENISRLKLLGNYDRQIGHNILFDFFLLFSNNRNNRW